MNKEKFIIAVALVALAVAAFYIVKQEKTIKESQANIENLNTDLNQTKESESQLKDLSERQNAELSDIMQELAVIAGRTSNLKIDVESGAAELSTAQHIERSIDAIRNRIAKLEQSNAKASRSNKEFQKVIDNFKVVVAEQEKEIANLKEEIAQKNVKIKSQQNTIEAQLKTISEQNAILQNLLVEQAQALYDAGKDLEAIGDASPQVRFKKNKQKVEDHATQIYNRSMVYYQKALNAGCEAASERLDSVKIKLGIAQ